MTGCVVQWLLQLNEFDITVVTLRGSQSLYDLLVQFFSRECKPLHKELACKEIYSV